jgi:hypothetical protein
MRSLHEHSARRKGLEAGAAHLGKCIALQFQGSKLMETE